MTDARRRALGAKTEVEAGEVQSPRGHEGHQALHQRHRNLSYSGKADQLTVRGQLYLQARF